jgi:hypothetical protein
MAGAGSSQRQKARRSTMSTALSRLDPSASAMLADLYSVQCFEEPDRDGAARALGAKRPAICALVAGGIDLPVLRWLGVD